MLVARRTWRATAALLASLTLSAPALGSEPPGTVSVTTNASDARMTRALVLIRGELSAVGLDLQVRSADDLAASAPDTSSDRMSLDVKDGAIVVRVYAAGAQAPLVESVDLDGPEVTAEVIAVRAVEALRAAQLLPSPTQRTPTPKPPSPPPTAPRKAEPVPIERAPAAHSTRAVPLLQLALGPTLVQNLQGPPQLNAQAALAIGPSWGFVALGAEGSLTRLDFERTPGSAQISRRTSFLQFGGRVRLHRAWELNARAGVNYLHYRARGSAQPGYSAQSLEHETGGVSLSVGGAYYFARAFGAYLDFGGLVAFDAARVRLADESVVTLDQPSFRVGIGLLLGAF